MAAVGARIAHEKRLALATCNGLLTRACEQLDELMERENRLDVDEMEELGPLALRVIELRRRRRRLQEELHAVASEWTLN